MFYACIWPDDPLDKALFTMHTSVMPLSYGTDPEHADRSCLSVWATHCLLHVIQSSIKPTHHCCSARWVRRSIIIELKVWFNWFACERGSNVAYTGQVDWAIVFFQRASGCARPMFFESHNGESQEDDAAQSLLLFVSVTRRAVCPLATVSSIVPNYLPWKRDSNRSEKPLSILVHQFKTLHSLGRRVSN